MTTGAWSVGALNAAQFRNTPFLAAKSWTGSDGRYVTTRATRKAKWNTYTMSHRKFDSSGGTPGNGVVSRVTGPESVTNVSYSNPVTWNTSTNDTYAQGQAEFESRFGPRTELKLLAKLINKVKGHDFNVGVSLAEVDRFSSGVVSSIKQFGFGAVDLYNRRFEAFARRFGTYPPSKSVTRRLRTLDISGRFLEMRYAWEPAVRDVYSASKAFEALSNGPRQQVVKATLRRSGSDYSLGNYRFREWYDWVATRTYTYEAYEELSAFRQMGLGNPASILWERIPYSFVLDWFIPIGTYLELIGQVPYLKGRFMRTSSYKETYSDSWDIDPNGTASPLISRDFAVKGSHYWIQRTLPGSLSVPPPTVRVAGAIQGRRVLNALALSHQIFAQAVTFSLGNARLRRGKINYVERDIDTTLIEKLVRV